MDKTTFYKGDQTINITPEEAVTFQGGVQGDEWKGLLASGWNQNAPTPPTPTPTPTPTPETPETPVEPTETEQAGIDENQALKDQIVQKQTDIDRYNTEFENLTADIEEIDAGNHPMIQDIKDTFARRSEEMKVQNEAIKNQTKIAGLRGMARYASQTQRGFISNEIKNGMDRLSQLESQKMTAIMEAKRALKSDRKDKWATFSNFMAQATQAYDSKINAIKDLHTALKDDEDRVRILAQADLDLQTQVREEAEATAENVAGSIYSSLGDNVEDNIQYIVDKAEQYGLDVDLLIGTVQAYAQDEADNALEVSSKLLTMGAKIAEGETVEVAPGIFVKGTKIPDEKFVDTIVGNTKFTDLWTRKDGKWEKTQRIAESQAYKPSTKTTPVDDEGYSGWEWEEEVVKLNHAMSDEELELELRKNTVEHGKLSDSDITKMIGNRKSYQAESDFDIEFTAQTLYDDKSKSDALQEIEDYDITDVEREKLKELYMSKRSLFGNDPN